MNFKKHNNLLQLIDSKVQPLTYIVSQLLDIKTGLLEIYKEN